MFLKADSKVLATEITTFLPEFNCVNASFVVCSTFNPKTKKLNNWN
jgi:hypothetical protein